MTEQITGAQSLDPVAGDGGRRDRLRHPRRRDPARLRPADGLHDPAHPGAPRAGRRPRGRGLRPGDRPGRRLHGDVGPGRHQPGDADRRRLHGLVPMVAITGQVPSAAIGTDAFQEADIRGITMPITKHNFLVTDPADIPRTIAEAFHIATHRPARPGAGRHGQGRAAGETTFLAAERRPAAATARSTPPARQAGARGGPADRRGQAAGAVRRRRRAQGAGAAASCARSPSSPASRSSPP